MTSRLVHHYYTKDTPEVRVLEARLTRLDPAQESDIKA